MDDTHALLYDLRFKTSDLYYQNNRYKNVGLEDHNCIPYLGAKGFETDDVRKIFTETYCKTNVFEKPKPSEDDINHCYNYALCKNKRVSRILTEKMGSKSSSKQNINDTKSFYNVHLLQTINLSLGMFLAIGGIIYVNIKKAEE